ncbi:rho-related GTP-binding protein RhoF-like [Acanthochromis polyacanthus]|uniref:rho-related GTP-binding protein RhoF-like n=1 Tax=Acanthochromis polyacanthus TaxID=80966 RepID=UPI0022340A69|nr:rho-related GTP-binding protein RhoF-like [Acanthochromis polyacanthus]
MTQKGLGASRESTSEQKEFKVAIVGEGLCGRSSLIKTYTTGVFPESWTPTVFESTVANTVFEGQEFQLNIWDCSAIKDYDYLRSLSYSDVDVVLICYDVMSPSSFHNVFQKWYPEVKHFCVGVPIILVGCKTDLRSDKFLEEELWSLGQNYIKYTQGEEAGRKINAAAYLECSARCNENVENVFREAIKQALMAKRVKDRCVLS